MVIAAADPRSIQTRCEVVFHSDEGNFDGTILEAHPVLGHVVGVSTAKTLGGASGSFQITIKKPTYQKFAWTRLFSNPEGTWVRLNYIINGVRFPVLWGMVDAINEAVIREGSGSRSETYTITGRDFGKVFEDTKTIVNLFAPGIIDMFAGILQAYNTRPPIGSPDIVVKSVMELWLGNNGLAHAQYRLPKSLAALTNAQAFWDMLNTDTIEEMDEGSGVTLDQTVLNPDSQGGQAIWDILQQYNNGVLNEMWVDLAPTARNPQSSIGRNTDFRVAGEEADVWRPAFFLRERRFRVKGSTSLWDNTAVHELDRDMLRGRQLAKGGASNRYNYWLLHGGVLGGQYEVQALTESVGVEPFKPGAIPIIDIESMQKHGIRPYVVTTNFLPFYARGRNGATQNVMQLAANWLKRIHDWYGVAPYQLSGTLTTSYIRPDIRVGQRVREARPEGPITYYVEGVSHNWNYPGPGSTTLTVTHGQYDDQSALDRLYADYDLQHADMKALNEILEDRDPQIREQKTRAPQKGKKVIKKPRPRKGADPKMVGSLGNRDKAQAREIAKGNTTNPLPDKERDSRGDRSALSQKNLEDGQKVRE